MNTPVWAPLIFGPPPPFLPEHFGPPYAAETLYYRGRITFDDCVYVIGRRTAGTREEMTKLLAYYIWKNNNGTTSEASWHEAESALVAEEKAWAQLTIPIISYSVP